MTGSPAGTKARGCSRSSSRLRSLCRCFLRDFVLVFLLTLAVDGGGMEKPSEDIAETPGVEPEPAASIRDSSLEALAAPTKLNDLDPRRRTSSNDSSGLAMVTTQGNDTQDVATVAVSSKRLIRRELPTGSPPDRGIPGSMAPLLALSRRHAHRPKTSGDAAASASGGDMEGASPQLAPSDALVQSPPPMAAAGNASNASHLEVDSVLPAEKTGALVEKGAWSLLLSQLPTAARERERQGALVAHRQTGLELPPLLLAQLREVGQRYRPPKEANPMAVTERGYAEPSMFAPLQSVEATQNTARWLAIVGLVVCIVLLTSCLGRFLSDSSSSSAGFGSALRLRPIGMRDSTTQRPVAKSLYAERRSIARSMSRLNTSNLERTHTNDGEASGLSDGTPIGAPGTPRVARKSSYSERRRMSRQQMAQSSLGSSDPSPRGGVSSDTSNPSLQAPAGGNGNGNSDSATGSGDMRRQSYAERRAANAARRASQIGEPKTDDSGR
eukprot:TRINITY_DN83044_c0_g1_i1.p1 TRINITY_DN83044_c0_g1~~TRINITY_DN83044_c0_g1_i1.p1  ORF type:complete len:498 (-),score=54.65 TRINITY_DN83044_c0_g1_i1:252-1745(-)